MKIPQTHSDASVRRGPAIFAGLVIAMVAFGLRWPQLQESLWLDELHTAWCVSGSWGDVAPRAAIGNQSPLFFYLLRLVVGVGGLSEVSLRLSSLIAGLVLIGVTGAATARWTGSVAAGLFAATLVALDRNCIFYSQEARPYAFLQVVAWCHAMVVWELARQVTVTRRMLFVMGAVLQFYLHYTSALFLAAEIVFLLDAMLRRDSRECYRWRQLALDLTLVAAAALPTVRHLAEVGSRRELWEQFVKQPNIYDFWHSLRLEVYLFPPVAMLVAWILLKRGWKSEPDAANSTLRRSMSLISCLLFVPAVLAWIATRRHLAALFLGRYLVSSLVAAPIGAAVLGRLFPSARMRFAVAGITIVASLWTAGMWQQWRRDNRLIGDRNQDWRGAVEFVNHHALPSDSVGYVRSGFVEADGLRSPHPPLLEEYCLAPVNSLYRLQIKAIPLPSAREIEIDPDWLRSDAPVVRWFLINGSSQTRQQFMADVERQSRDLGLPNPFAQFQTFGDILVCELARKKNSR